VLRCCRRHGFRCTGKDSDLGIGEFPYMVIAWLGKVKLSAQPRRAFVCSGMASWLHE